MSERLCPGTAHSLAHPETARHPLPLVDHSGTDPERWRLSSTPLNWNAKLRQTGRHDEKSLACSRRPSAVKCHRCRGRLADALGLQQKRGARPGRTRMQVSTGFTSDVLLAKRRSYVRMAGSSPMRSFGFRPLPGAEHSSAALLVAPRSPSLPIMLY